MGRSITANEQRRRSGGPCGLGASLALALLLLAPLSAPAADWQEAERACVARCPAMPRYSGVETDAQYHARMRLQKAHDECFLKCAAASAATQPPSFVPIGEVERRYFKRNGG